MIASPSGGLYFGTVYWGAAGMERHGKLYCMDGGGVRVVDEGIELANGLGFSADGKTLYFADSAARRVFAYDVDRNGGGLSRKAILTEIDASSLIWQFFDQHTAGGQ